MIHRFIGAALMFWAGDIFSAYMRARIYGLKDKNSLGLYTVVTGLIGLIFILI